jgi:outer membrane protein assembly factor BamB
MAAGECTGSAAEMYRVLRPAGGVALLGQLPGSPTPLAPGELAAWLDGGGLDYSYPEDMEGVWAKVVRPPIAGAGDWTHQYGSPDNSASSHDALEGATQTGEMAVQWIGRPGGDAVMDRNPRKPAPLVANGRVFLQGFHRIIAMDAYNGAILWSLEIPDLIRTNIPRDAGNWCADEDCVYAAIRDRCWRLDASSGELTAVYDVAAAPPQDTHDWGYVASVGGELFGSSTRKGAAYTEFMGHSSWYDQKSGYGTWKVCSDDLFQLDKADGSRNWTYANGVIINTTITIGGGRVYFVECRNTTVKASPQRRVALNELWRDQYLVALDAATGGLLWEEPIDTADGIVVFFLGYTDVPSETLVLGLSHTSYHMYAFDAAAGQAKWHVQHSWPSDNHGGHMQHPVLVAGNAYLWPSVYRVTDGARVAPNMPGREGCPTIAAGSRTFVFRGPGRIISLWDSQSGRLSGWQSIRPGCWLSVVPAAGMILAPEAGAGCSCGGWLQTSVGYSRKE